MAYFLRPLAVLAWMIAMAAAGCRSEEPAQPVSEIAPAPLQGTIVAFGNSLTEGFGVDPDDAYPARLERGLRALGHHYRVINAGVSGETSSGALSRTDWILKLDPDIVILETGANDGLRGLDPDLTLDNLNRIVDKLSAHGTIVVLAGMKMTLNLGRAFTRKFMAVYPQVAQRHNIALIPFFLEGVAADPALNLSDGIHPNAKGYEIVARNVMPYVAKAIKER